MKAKAILASLLMLVAVGLSAQEKAPVKKYGFKSAIAKFATEVMGQAVESTIYIDEYGAKECQKAKVQVPGMGTMESGVISKEGKTWNVNYTMKQVQEVAINPGSKYSNASDTARTACSVSPRRSCSAAYFAA